MNILTLDGGGVRGVFTTTILERLYREYPSLINSTDFIAGTSTGGIIALGLAYGYLPEVLTNFYLQNAEEIFDRRSRLCGGGTIRADYDNADLQVVLERFFKDYRLEDCMKTVLIPAFNLWDVTVLEGKSVKAWKPKFYHNIRNEPDGNDELAKIVDVAMMTSAAPVYFPSHLQHVDGGVAANNPSMSAIAQVLHSYKQFQLYNLRLLSIGTGFSPQFIDTDVDWGITQWARPLVNIFMDASSGTVDYECNELLGEHYMRVNKVLSQKIDLDDTSKMMDLRAEAQEMDLAPVVEWLKNNWK